MAYDPALYDQSGDFRTKSLRTVFPTLTTRIKTCIVVLTTVLHAFFLRRIWDVVGFYYTLKIRKYPRLQELYRIYKTQSKSTGVNVWDAVILYEKVRAMRPAYILELGTGASTAYMALALEENAMESSAKYGVLVSVENDKEYFQHQQAIFPGNLLGYVELVHSSLGLMEIEGCPAFFYESIPTYPYDLIWVDGPALTDEIRVSGDVVNILPSCAENALVLFDGRTLTAKVCAKHLGNDYVLKTRPQVHMSMICKRL